MQLLDMCFSDFVRCMINDIIHAAEMVHCFDDIINARILGGYAKGVCLEDITCLLFGEPRAFYVVGVVSKINLRAVLNTTF